MPPYSGASADLPETDRACAEVLSLPMHPHLSHADVDAVAAALKAAIREAAPPVVAVA